MSLRGSLETVGLPDVLTLAGHDGQDRRTSGDRCQHAKAGCGSKEGQLIGSDAGRADSHLDAIFELLRRQHGNVLVRGRRGAVRGRRAD